MPSHSASEWCGTGRSSSKKSLDGGADLEPPATPPIIISSENSCKGGPQPQGQDPVHVPPHLHTSFSRSPSSTFEKKPLHNHHSSALSKPKPEPEPHPAPPVIILSYAKHSAPASPSTSSSYLSPRRRIPADFVDGSCQITALDPANKDYTMGSKASKLAPRNGKLQSSQEKKDKEEMKEPTNYYTHRSKSMRRRAGKEANSDGAGGNAGGSAGGAGGIA